MVLLNSGNFCFQLATDITASNSDDDEEEDEEEEEEEDEDEEELRRSRRRQLLRQLLSQRVASALPPQRRQIQRLQKQKPSPLVIGPRGSASRWRNIEQVEA